MIQKKENDKQRQHNNNKIIHKIQSVELKKMSQIEYTNTTAQISLFNE